MGTASILAIVTAILKYGPTAITSIAKALEVKEDITPEDIKELFIDKDPEDYFNDV